MALARASNLTGYPYRTARVAPDGWLYIPDTGEWVWLEGYDHSNAVSLEDGWLRAWLPDVPASQERQPDERPPFKGTASLGAGWYVEQHPTHFGWREDVARLVFEMEEKYWTFACTYDWHPPYDPPYITERYDDRSVDFWDVEGRGYALDPSVGYDIINDLFYRDTGPPIAWYLWQGHIWTPSGGLQSWWNTDPASDGAHTKHLHVTYF